MEKMSGLITREKEFQDGSAHVHVQIKCAVDEFELFDASIQQPLKLIEQGGQGNLPYRDVE
jgi:hypothetical protein